MKVIPQKDCDISEIVTALKEGKTIVYPTETCYGLGCDATNPDAVRKIFQIKGRMGNKPLLILASDITMVHAYMVGSDLLDSVAKKYWPGPLTVVALKKLKVVLPEGVVSSDKTIAIRISSNEFIQNLVKALGKPIVSTSANLAGADNPFDSKDIMRVFSGRHVAPDILISAGELPVCKPSTIVSVASGKIEVVRQGDVEIGDKR